MTIRGNPILRELWHGSGLGELKKTDDFRFFWLFRAALPNSGRYATPAFGVIYIKWAIQDRNTH